MLEKAVQKLSFDNEVFFYDHPLRQKVTTKELVTRANDTKLFVEMQKRKMIESGQAGKITQMH